MRRICATALLLLVALSTGHTQTQNEPARRLEGRAVENLVAFTKLLGYVRYFHPSDEAAAENWDQFAVRGVKAVEAAATPAELARRLEEVFRPIAPTVRVYPSGQTPALPELAAPGPSAKLTAWNHFGVGVSAQSMYRSSRSHRRDANLPGQFGNVMQAIAAAPLRGKRIRYRAAVRVEPEGEDGRAQLWLRVDRPGQQMGFFDNMDARPIRSREWNVYEIAGDVAPDAQQIYFGAMLLGRGSAWVDDVTVEVLEEGKEPAPVAVVNAGFEQETGGTPTGWSAARGTVYRVETATSGSRSGQRAARLFTQETEPSTAGAGPAAMAKPLVADLGAGVSAFVPMTLYLDERGTVPAGAPQRAAPAALTGNDRATRLAAVALAWNIFQHFYPYFDVVETDWPRALRNALSEAAADKDANAFVWTLRRLVGELKDGHGGVMLPGEPAFKPPFSWRWIENRLVVTYLLDGAPPELAVGDIVTHVDGKPSAEALAAAEKLVSGATLAYRQLRAWRTMLTGEEGSVIELRLRKASGEERAVKVPRSVAAAQFREEKPVEKLFEIRPGILYADLRAMTTAEFEQAVPKLAEAKGIIYELRGYPRVGVEPIGHLTGEPVTCARWHIPIVHQPDRAGMTFDFSNWTVAPRTPRIQAKVAFLTDERAISYAETFLGIIENYRLAEIVGAPTAGTNGNVNPFPLPGGYRVMWTGMKVLKHDGSVHHGVGIRPTIPVSPTIAGIRAGRDEVLERGIQAVSP